MTDQMHRDILYTDNVHMTAIATMQCLGDTLIARDGWIEYDFTLQEYANLIIEAAIRVNNDGTTFYLDTPFEDVAEHFTLIDAIQQVQTILAMQAQHLVDTTYQHHPTQYRRLCCESTPLVIDHVQSILFTTPSIPQSVQPPSDGFEIFYMFLGVWAFLVAYSDDVLAHQRAVTATTRHAGCTDLQLVEQKFLTILHYVRGFQQALDTVMQRYDTEMPTPWLAAMILSELESFLQSADTLYDTAQLVETMVKW